MAERRQRDIEIVAERRQRDRDSGREKTEGHRDSGREKRVTEIVAERREGDGREIQWQGEDRGT